jgi:hypothetical protein
MAALQNASFNMPNHLVDPLQIDLSKTQDLIFNNLQYNGVLFNPRIIQDLELLEDQDAMARFMRVFQRLSDTNEEFQAVKVKFNQYFYVLSPYCGDHIWIPRGSQGSAPHMVVYMW